MEDLNLLRPHHRRGLASSALLGGDVNRHKADPARVITIITMIGEPDKCLTVGGAPTWREPLNHSIRKFMTQTLADGGRCIYFGPPNMKDRSLRVLKRRPIRLVYQTLRTDCLP